MLTALAHTFASRTDMLTDVVTRARQHHHDSRAHRRAELATVEAEIASARAAIDRYLTAFENGTMNDTTCAPRIATLEAKIIQLDVCREELVDLISTEPTAPGADVLDALRRRIRRVVAAGTPAQRKELIEAMVAEIRIDGDTVYPIFLVPRDDETPAETISTGVEEPPFRTMVRSVEPRGLEPLTPTLPVWCATSCATAPSFPVSRAPAQ